MRITSKGRITIPAKIRKHAGFLPGTEVDFAFDGSAVSIIPVSSGKEGRRGARIVAHLRAHRGDVAMTTDEIMALTRGE